jgi:subtilisin family serine protease
MNRFAFVLVALAALVLGLGAPYTSIAADKIKIEKLDDLPRHTYKIDMKAAEFVENMPAVLKLAEQVKADLEADLAKYDIADKTTMQGMYAGLGTIALLNEKYDVYLDYLSKRKALEDKEATKLTMGMVAAAYAQAKQNGKPFKTVLEENVKPLPYDLVQDNLKSGKASFEMMSKPLAIGGIEAGIQPILDKSNGELSQDIAGGLLNAALSLRMMIPLKDDVVAVYGAVIEAHNVVKKDIWADRDITLTQFDGKAPVVIGIWDSGVDTDIFSKTSQLWTNAKEVADNNKDDDNNGYVDDVHGIAYGLHSDKEIPLLYPIGDVTKDRPRLQRQMKGLEDLQSAIDSPEAKEIKQMMATLPKDSVKPVFENIGKYGNYCHGTHVAGIAAHGNPFARILVSRITFDYHMLPELPTEELSRKDSLACTQVVDYFKKNGVRVVNMSWGGSLRSIEDALEANNWGATPEERKAQARKLYEISKAGLFGALKNAPEILFVISAGNSNNDVKFEEYYPSSFDLPNVFTVGAVDQAGEETSFSSFGKVEVYANGSEVMSYVPGGDQLALSGTSMSSPNVTNLAAKLLAVKPDLTVAQLRDAIVKGCDDKKAGDRPIKLINPKKSLALIAAK